MLPFISLDVCTNVGRSRYHKKYTHQDGRLVYEPGLRGTPDLLLDPDGGITASRDGLDDFYESFYNWPLLYLLGGGDDLLTLGQRQFDATTKLGVELGHIHDEYEGGVTTHEVIVQMLELRSISSGWLTHPVSGVHEQWATISSTSLSP